MRYLQLSEARHAFVRIQDHATVHIVNTVDRRLQCGCPMTGGTYRYDARRQPVTRVCSKCARNAPHTIITEEASDVRD